MDFGTVSMRSRAATVIVVLSVCLTVSNAKVDNTTGTNGSGVNQTPPGNNSTGIGPTLATDVQVQSEIECARVCFMNKTYSDACCMVLFKHEQQQGLYCGLNIEWRDPDTITSKDVAVHVYQQENSTTDLQAPSCSTFIVLSENQTRTMSSPANVTSQPCRLLVSAQPGQRIKMSAQLLCNQGCTTEDVLFIDNVLGFETSSTHQLSQPIAVCLGSNSSQSEHAVLLSTNDGYFLWELWLGSGSAASYNITLSAESISDPPCSECTHWTSGVSTSEAGYPCNRESRFKPVPKHDNLTNVAAETTTSTSNLTSPTDEIGNSSLTTRNIVPTHTSELPSNTKPSVGTSIATHSGIPTFQASYHLATPTLQMPSHNSKTLVDQVSYGNWVASTNPISFEKSAVTSAIISFGGSIEYSEMVSYENSVISSGPMPSLNLTLNELVASDNLVKTSVSPKNLVTSSELVSSENLVTSSKLVSSENLVTTSVSSENLVTTSISSENLVTASVSSENLVTASVSSENLVTASVSSENLVTSSELVSLENLVTSSVSSENLVTSSILVSSENLVTSSELVPSENLVTPIELLSSENWVISTETSENMVSPTELAPSDNWMTTTGLHSSDNWMTTTELHSSDNWMTTTGLHPSDNWMTTTELHSSDNWMTTTELHSSDNWMTTTEPSSHENWVTSARLILSENSATHTMMFETGNLLTVIETLSPEYSVTFTTLPSSGSLIKPSETFSPGGVVTAFELLSSRADVEPISLGTASKPLASGTEQVSKNTISRVTSSRPPAPAVTIKASSTMVQSVGETSGPPETNVSTARPHPQGYSGGGGSSATVGAVAGGSVAAVVVAGAGTAGLLVLYRRWRQMGRVAPRKQTAEETDPEIEMPMSPSPKPTTT
ncbi:mucin-3A isoform X3 [Aplysia californica]|nr:mucin-3A isoform X3 [Aplysia californica]